MKHLISACCDNKSWFILQLNDVTNKHAGQPRNKSNQYMDDTTNKVKMSFQEEGGIIMTVIWGKVYVDNDNDDIELDRV